MAASFIANGNITPAVFVKQDTTIDNAVIQATANASLIGIAQKGTHNTPLSGLNDGYAAVAGGDILVYQENEVAPITLGGTVAAGDYLEATTGGVAITCSTDGHNYGGRALQAGVSGQMIECLVLLGQRGV